MITAWLEGRLHSRSPPVRKRPKGKWRNAKYLGQGLKDTSASSQAASVFEHENIHCCLGVLSMVVDSVDASAVHSAYVAVKEVLVRRKAQG